MKKNISIFLLALLSTAIMAQKRYISLQYGYSVGVNSSFVTDADIVYINSSTYTGTVGLKSLALGRGGTGSLSYGYFFNHHVGYELAFSSLVGLVSNQSVHEIIPSSYNMNYDITQKYSYSAYTFGFAPSLIISTDIQKKYTLYNRCGIILANSEINRETNQTLTWAGYTSNTVYNTRLRGNVRLGFTAAVGGTCQLSPRWTGFAELQLRALSFIPTKGTIDSYTVDGVDKLSELYTYQKETRYYDHISNYGTSQANDQPSNALKTTYSLSGVGLSIGLRYNL